MSDYNVLLELAQSGCYLERDLFGIESSYYPLSDIDMPSDAQRMDIIKRLIGEGYREKIVIAHDIAPSTVWSGTEATATDTSWNTSSPGCAEGVSASRTFTR